MAWRLAGSPINRSPWLVNATVEGVVRLPSEFSITRANLPSITATQEFVVPRSMPITVPAVVRQIHPDKEDLTDPLHLAQTPSTGEQHAFLERMH